MSFISVAVLHEDQAGSVRTQREACLGDRLRGMMRAIT